MYETYLYMSKPDSIRLLRPDMLFFLDIANKSTQFVSLLASGNTCRPLPMCLVVVDYGKESIATKMKNRKVILIGVSNGLSHE